MISCKYCKNSFSYLLDSFPQLYRPTICPVFRSTPLKNLKLYQSIGIDISHYLVDVVRN